MGVGFCFVSVSAWMRTAILVGLSGSGVLERTELDLTTLQYTAEEDRRTEKGTSPDGHSYDDTVVRGGVNEDLNEQVGRLVAVSRCRQVLAGQGLAGQGHPFTLVCLCFTGTQR